MTNVSRKLFPWSKIENNKWIKYVRKLEHAFLQSWESTTWILCALNFPAIFPHLTHTEEKARKFKLHKNHIGNYYDWRKLCSRVCSKKKGKKVLYHCDLSFWLRKPCHISMKRKFCQLSNGVRHVFLPCIVHEQS